MSDGKPKVTANQLGSQGALDAAVEDFMEVSGAACVAMFALDHAGKGTYSVTGSLEAQLRLPDVLEKVAQALRTHLSGSVH